jgi:hypothetical protein
VDISRKQFWESEKQTRGFHPWPQTNHKNPPELMNA